MSHKRSKLEIYLDVLTAISQGETLKTRIMFRSNLSWRPLKVVLKSCVDQGLVRNRGGEGRPRYQITEKGLGILRDYREAETRFDYSRTA